MRGRLIPLVLTAALVAAACGRGQDPAVAPPERTTSTAGAPIEGAGATTTAAGPLTTVVPVPSTEAPDPAAAGGGAFECPPVPDRATPRPDRPRHHLAITVDPGGRAVAGTLTTTFTPDLPTDELVYRLWPNGPRPASGGASLHVSFVTVDDRAVAARQPAPTVLEVPVAGGLGPGETVVARVDFELRLPGAINDRVAAGDGWMRLGSFYPTLEWQPGLGWNTAPPTGGFAEASVAPAADYTLAVTVPEGFDVLAAGVPQPDGTWRSEAARDVALTVGRFGALATATAQAGRPVEVVVAAHDGIVDPAPFATKVARVLEELAARYGAYPWPRYTLAITPALSGGIEYPAHVLQGPDTLGRTTSHEVAHMWFYGLVGNHQGTHPWLDEGLATWVEGVMEGTLGSMQSRAIPRDAQGRVGEPMTYWDAHSSSYYRGVYVQGAQALSALGEVAVVDCVLAHYTARFAHRIATPHDFGTVAESIVSGARDALNRYGAGV